jgi:protein phosphatase
MIEVRQLEIDKSKRTIIISDIHANLALFKKILHKVNYTKEDYLFINGDLCEKGPESLAVIEYAQEVSKQSANVYITKGNCDVVHRYVFNGNEGIITYMSRQKNSILNEMLAKYSRSIEDFPNLSELASFYRQHFHEEIKWLESRPIAYETEEFILIHAGIENIKDWKRTEEKTALYAQAFYEQGHQADKLVIVGHWPVVNYRAQQISSNNPLIDFDKKIIALDGGNQIKKDGQLNALIIKNGTYSFTYVDELSEDMVIQKDHIDLSGRVGTVTYPNYELKIIKEDEYFTLCENIKLGIQQWIKNEYLLVENEQIHCKSDLSTTFLSVNQGDRVSIVDNECDGYSLVKKTSGEVGWIPKDCLETVTKPWKKTT